MSQEQDNAFNRLHRLAVARKGQWVKVPSDDVLQLVNLARQADHQLDIANAKMATIRKLVNQPAGIPARPAGRQPRLRYGS